MWIDVTRLVGRRLKGRLPTGVDRVALAYVERFAIGLHGGTARVSGAQALLRLGRLQLCLPAAASQRVFHWLLTAESAEPWAVLPAAVMAALGAALPAPWRRWHTKANAETPRWLIQAGHSGLEHAHWARSLRSQGVRPLVFVHDLIPITHPQFYRAGEADRHARRMRHALSWAGAVVTNSQATLDALVDWAQAQRLPLPASAVAHLGPGTSAPALSSAAVACARPLRGPYFLMLGTLEPRKNHALVFKVWERLVQRVGALATPRLVLVGQPGWEIESLLRELQRTPALQDVVIHRPHCSDAERAQWLVHAQALLLPSFVEGFGMPLVEALAAGVPVLASDLPVFREVAGAVPDYLDPLDGPRWLAAIEAYTAGDDLARQTQLARLQGFRAPSWAAHFAAVDALMNAAAPA